MNEVVPIPIPTGARIYNRLYRDPSIHDLDQDLLTIAFENGRFVDVGWYPEHDPQGAYIVRAFAGSWEHQLINPYRTTDVYDAAAIAARLAAACT